jgi:hypothetical protein
MVTLADTAGPAAAMVRATVGGQSVRDAHGAEDDGENQEEGITTDLGHAPGIGPSGPAAELCRAPWTPV